MVDLCYWYHVRKSCKFGARCRFVHETTYDPTQVYYTCTVREKRVLKNIESVFLPTPTPLPKLKSPSKFPTAQPTAQPQNPSPAVIIISFKQITTDHDGYCSGAEDFTEEISYGCARRYNNTDKSDIDFAREQLPFDGSRHCCCGCGDTFEILLVERGLERWPKPCTTFDRVILLPLPGELSVVIWEFLGKTRIEMYTTENGA